MAQTTHQFDTAHGGTIHDAQLDYYGKRLATASADHAVRIWDVSTDKANFVGECKGHEGPVWQVCWAHPRYGNLLASCSYDKRVLVWKDTQLIYRNEDHLSSVNGVAFCPPDYGLILASVSSDGTVGVMSYRADGTWERKDFTAHHAGAQCVAWAPIGSGASQLGEGGAPRLATGGCDNSVKVWRLEGSNWEKEDLPAVHTDWVRDVAWRPHSGMSASCVASGSEDGRVVLWTQESGQPWRVAQTIDVGQPVFRVSWSVTGSQLAIACGDNQVLLYKETIDGRWEPTNSIDEKGITQLEQPAPSATTPAQDHLQPADGFGQQGANGFGAYGQQAAFGQQHSEPASAQTQVDQAAVAAAFAGW